MKNIVLIAFLTVTAAPQMATAGYLAHNDLIVHPQNANAFSIPYRGKSGARDFWCAASDYVMRELKLRGSTRIYRTSPPPRRAGMGISFSLKSENASESGLGKLHGGKGVSASHAASLCDSFIARK